MSERPPLDLDARQDEVLQQLDELNARIEAAIKEFAPQTLVAPDTVTMEQKETEETKKAA